MKNLILLISIVVLPLSAIAQDDFCKGDFDYDRDVDGSDIAVIKQNFPRSIMFDPCPPDGPAPVPKSGQTVSYATGDDGEHQRGVVLPNQRFTDNGDGTVTDNLTGLIWPKDMQQIPGVMDWQTALDACNNLELAEYDDWRLPNLRELQSLLDYGNHAPALPQDNPFINVWSLSYWTSTTRPNPFFAWFVNLEYGEPDTYGKAVSTYALCVRGGH